MRSARDVPLITPYGRYVTVVSSESAADRVELLAVLRDLVAAKTPADAEAATLTAVRSLVRADAAFWMDLVDDSFRMTALSGLVQPEAHLLSTVPVGDGLSSEILAADTPLAVTDYHSYARAVTPYAVLFRNEGIISVAGVPMRSATGFAGVRLLAAVGDMTGDGYPDLMGQPSGGSMRIYPGRGLKGLKQSYVAYAGISASSQVPVGLWDGDGAPDSMFRNGKSLRLYPGNGPGGLMGSQSMNVKVGAYDWLIGVSDLTSGGRPDLIARRKSDGTLFAIQGGKSGFQSRRVIGEGMSIYDLAG